MNRRIAAFALVSVLLVSAGAYAASNAGSGGPSEAALLVGSERGNVENGRLVEYGFEAVENATLVPNRGGSGYDGLVEGNPTSVSGKDGSAVRFNGSESRIVVENSTAADFADGVTFAFWVYPDGEQDANLLKADGFCSIFISQDAVNFVVVRNETRIAELRSEIPVGEWAYVVGTYDSEAGARLYVNGELTDANATVSGSPSPPTENVTLNAASWKDGFTGSIDEFAVWTRALSAAEVQTVRENRDRDRILSGLLRIAIAVLALVVIAGVAVRERAF